MTVTHHTGHVLNLVRQLPDASVDAVIGSPPFLALRDYNGLPDQWGSEPTPAAFLAHLLELTTELRRVLTPHGSIAIELGDTFAGSGGAGGDYNENGLREGQAKFGGSARAGRCRDGWPAPKSLCGTPTLYAWSLAYGRNLLDPAQTVEPWLIRNLIVWARNNPPVGALGDKYRPATSYITVACPSDKRWFDLDAVRSTPHHGFTSTRAGKLDQPSSNVPGQPQRRTNPVGTGGVRVECNPAGAPPLDHWHDEYDGDLTWLVNTAGSSLAHYAMWPAKLAERLILSMCPAEVCRTCREPRRRITSDRERFTSVQPEIATHIRECRERAGLTSDDLNRQLGYKKIAKNWERTDKHSAAIPSPGDWLKLRDLIGVSERFDPIVMGDRRWHKSHIEYVDGQGRQAEAETWQSGMAVGMGAHSLKGKSLTARAPAAWSDCGHGNYRPGLVLDPFAGTGTTLAVADIHGRDAIGIDLDPANVALYRTRWEQCWRALKPDAGPSPVTDHGEQLGLAL